MPPPPVNPDLHTMSFGDHLEELRRRLLFAVAAPLPLFVLLFFFSDHMIEWLLQPVYGVLAHNDLPDTLQVLSPPEFLLTKLKVSLIFSLVITAPWLLWHAWLFIAPGLYSRERRFVYFLIPGSFILTIAGVALLYFVMLPLMLHVLVLVAVDADFGAATPERDPQVELRLEAAREVPLVTAMPSAPADHDVWVLWPDLELWVAMPDENGVVVPVQVPRRSRNGIEQSFRLSWVINFTLVLMMGVVIAFQMPLVILLLGWLDLVSAGWLREKRRYALVVCGIVSAVITPADAVSMIMMLVPLYALYELGIILVVVAPASKVAEGGILRTRFTGWRKRAGGDSDNASADKGPSSAVETTEPVQSDASIPRSGPDTESGPEKSDGPDGTKEDER